MKEICLRTGEKELDIVVDHVFGKLKALWGQGYPGMLKVSDLIDICEGRGVGVSDRTTGELQRLELLRADGTPHPSVTKVIRASITGTYIGNMKLVSPVAPDGELDAFHRDISRFLRAAEKDGNELTLSHRDVGAENDKPSGELSSFHRDVSDFLMANAKANALNRPKI